MVVQVDSGRLWRSWLGVVEEHQPGSGESKCAGFLHGGTHHFWLVAAGHRKGQKVMVQLIALFWAGLVQRGVQEKGFFVSSVGRDEVFFPTLRRKVLRLAPPGGWLTLIIGSLNFAFSGSQRAEGKHHSLEEEMGAGR